MDDDPAAGFWSMYTVYITLCSDCVLIRPITDDKYSSVKK